MREHQIVITLKPEQFLEVQRMARAAGAKSMGMFVRQRLLRTLGMEPGGDSSAKAAKAVKPANLKHAFSELRRLHGELKSFVNESLSQSYVLEGDEPDAALDPDLDPELEPEREPEQELGPDPEPEPPEAVQQDPPPVAVDGFTQFNSDQLSYFVPGASLPGIAPIGDFDKILKDFREAEDALEKVARRAFSISPRLGALQSVVPAAESQAEDDSDEEARDRNKDPLEELLDEDLRDKTAAAPSRALSADSDGHDDEDDIFDVPLSLKNRPPERLERPAQPEPKQNAPPQPPGPSSSGPSTHPFSGGPPPKRRQ